MTGTASRSARSARPAGGRPPRGAGQTLAEGIRFKIESLISNGRYPPGTRLDEQEVAQRFGVSRTPVREAIRLLAADNLVELRGRQGTIVRAISAHDLLEMFQVMAELEGLSARLASRRMDEDDREQRRAQGNEQRPGEVAADARELRGFLCERGAAVFWSGHGHDFP